jgi:hypothetical protein
MRLPVRPYQDVPVNTLAKYAATSRQEVLWNAQNRPAVAVQVPITRSQSE